MAVASHSSWCILASLDALYTTQSGDLPLSGESKMSLPLPSGLPKTPLRPVKVFFYPYVKGGMSLGNYT